MCAAAGITLAGIVSIEQILSRLPVHHLTLREQTCQVVDGHRQLLGYLRGGEAVHTIQHLVAIVGLRCHDIYLLLLRLDGLLLNLQRQRHNLHVRELASAGILGGDIAARLADLRQHLRCHPAFEHLRLRQL